MQQEHTSRSPRDTRRLAADVVKTLQVTRQGRSLLRGVLALHGDLGSGKTCFVQGLAEALGVRNPVTSPTFTIVNEHTGERGMLYHMDLYRMRDAGEIFALGFDEYLEADGITAIEWAERAEELLPPDTLHIWFSVLPDPAHRRIVIRRN